MSRSNRLRQRPYSGVLECMLLPERSRCSWSAWICITRTRQNRKTQGLTFKCTPEVCGSPARLRVGKYHQGSQHQLVGVLTHIRCRDIQYFSISASTSARRTSAYVFSQCLWWTNCTPKQGPLFGANMFFRGNGAVLLNLEGRITHAGTRFCDLVGIEHTKVAGMSFFDFVFPEDIDKARELFEPYKKPPERQFRFRLRALNGVEVWADIRCAPARVASGDLCGVTAMISAADSEVFLECRNAKEHKLN